MKQLMAHRVIPSTVVAIIAALAVLFAGAGAGAPPLVIGKPGCETRCGEVSVPFPFGFGPARCSATGFQLTCDNTTTHPDKPRLLLGDRGVFEVKEISIKERMVRVLAPPIFSGARNNLGSSGAGGVMRGSWGDGSIRDRNIMQYVLSGGTESQMVVIGCNIEATLQAKVSSDNSYVAVGCSSSCAGDRVLTAEDVRRNYNGICSTTFGSDSTHYDVELKRLDVDGAIIKANDDLPVSVLIVHGDTFGDDLPELAVHMMNLGSSRRKDDDDDDMLLAQVVTLEWECINDGSCNASSSTHSDCGPKRGGLYSCSCRPGYEGNPYVNGGCQDIDECKNPKDNGCFGECNNKNGYFDCWCPPGHHGNASQLHGCIQTVKNTGLSAVVGASCGAGLIIAVLTTLYVSRRLKSRRTQISRQKFFKQNHGQLLEQLVSQSAGVAERMIITLDELEKATHNFDKDLVVGGGGHGTVYKGILSNQHIVAIKKPKKVVQKEIDEFINEVAILSQINHRNVVKLYGCCLETEVPMLIYEFISNGNLSEHLHVEGPRSLSWDDRLRIATETAKSLAYLHSTASVPIIHRDIKSANILLDDTLTAKVADFGASRYIPIEKSGVTTMAQGTRGYWDPMYFYTGRLTDKSDVYSFGVVLVELLTRKKPFAYLSSDDEALVVHFTTLIAEGNLVTILDPQVVVEAGKEAVEVANIAMSCIMLRAEDRPTMRQVELALESLRAPWENNLDNTVARNVCNNDIALDVLFAQDRRGNEGSTRRYSMEIEFILSSRFPR